MKKKALRILAACAAFVIIAGLCLFANALVGNPVSKMLASRTAKNHLAEVYPGTDYQIDHVSYNFKNGNYVAVVKSPSSKDTVFSLSLTMLGKLRWDSYEDVTSGFNTAMRLETEYRALVEAVLESPTFPYESDIDYGTLNIGPAQKDGSSKYGGEGASPYFIDQSELVLDKVYDIRELGRRAGFVVLYIDSDTVSIEKAAEILLHVKALFDEAGVPFAAIDFVLQYPRPEEGRRPEGDVRVEGFPYEDIREDGMTERLEAAHRALQEYYAEQDAKGK